jgi:hypothetical protein
MASPVRLRPPPPASDNRNPAAELHIAPLQGVSARQRVGSVCCVRRLQELVTGIPVLTLFRRSDKSPNLQSSHFGTMSHHNVGSVYGGPVAGAGWFPWVLAVLGCAFRRCLGQQMNPPAESSIAPPFWIFRAWSSTRQNRLQQESVTGIPVSPECACRLQPTDEPCRVLPHLPWTRK